MMNKNGVIDELEKKINELAGTTTTESKMEHGGITTENIKGKIKTSKYLYYFFLGISSLLILLITIPLYIRKTDCPLNANAPHT